VVAGLRDNHRLYHIFHISTGDRRQLYFCEVRLDVRHHARDIRPDIRQRYNAAFNNRLQRRIRRKEEHIRAFQGYYKGHNKDIPV